MDNFKHYRVNLMPQGLMLYGSEMEKPNMRHFTPDKNGQDYYNKCKERYTKSFQPICPIHKEHEEGFSGLLRQEWLNTKTVVTGESIIDRFEKALEQGIDIPSERIGFEDVLFICDDCAKLNRKTCHNGIPCSQQYAILLPEQKEQEINIMGDNGIIREAENRYYKEKRIRKFCKEVGFIEGAKWMREHIEQKFTIKKKQL